MAPHEPTTATDDVRLVAPPAPARTASEARAHRLAAAALGAMLVAVAVAVGVPAWRAWAPRVHLDRTFPDSALAACVARTLGADSPRAAVSRHDLDGVVTLTCRAGSEGAQPGRIHDLTGLDQLPRLAALGLAGQSISDLGPLRAVRTLTDVRFTGNAISDLSPLAGMPLLHDVGLSRNRLHDLSPLATLPSLRTLGIADNLVQDISPLAGARGLTELDLAGNAVSDLGPLASCAQLAKLKAADNRITDLSPLAGLAHLDTLDVARNRIADAGPFGGAEAFVRLRELWLGENQVRDVRPLLTLPTLIGVDLSGAVPGTPGTEELRAKGVFVGTAK